MKGLNERMNDNIIVVNVGSYAVAIITQDKPKGFLVGGGKTASILVKDLLSSLRGNKFVYGVDNKGTHAILHIDESEIRELLGFDTYEIAEKKSKEKDEGGKYKIIESKKLVNEQVVLSKDIFIKNVKVQSNSAFLEYADSLKEVTNGCKMMIAGIIRDERKKALSSLAVNRFDKLEEVILH